MTGIVVGIDGSQHSQRALEWAVKEAALRQATLTAVTVYQVAAGWGTGVIRYPQDQTYVAKARKDAADAVQKALEQAGDTRPDSVAVEATEGIPADELLNAAKDADMIVVGSRGTGGFARLLMGSVSSQVAHHAHCPVVIIPSDDRR